MDGFAFSGVVVMWGVGVKIDYVCRAAQVLSGWARRGLRSDRLWIPSGRLSVSGVVVIWGWGVKIRCY